MMRLIAAIAPTPTASPDIPNLPDLFRCANPVNDQNCVSGGLGITRLSGAPNFSSLGGVVSGVLDVVFGMVIFLTFFWMIWGAFEYIFAGGNKESLAKARSRIIYAIIGLILVALAFALAQFVEQLLQPQQKSPISFLATPVYASSIDLGQYYDFGNTNSLGEGVNRLIMPAFSIATTAVVIYLLVGAVRYIASGGNKEEVGKAQAMMTHAIVGFLILMFVFLILQFIPEFFGFKFSLF